MSALASDIEDERRPLPSHPGFYSSTTSWMPQQYQEKEQRYSQPFSNYFI